MAAIQHCVVATPETQAEQARIESTLREILALPFEACPWPAVRQALLARVLSGAPMHTYSYYSASVWGIEDNTYPDAPWSGTPRAWAIRNGYAVDGEAR